jgi:hypothetical protein
MTVGDNSWAARLRRKREQPSCSRCIGPSDTKQPHNSHKDLLAIALEIIEGSFFVITDHPVLSNPPGPSRLATPSAGGPTPLEATPRKGSGRLC